MITAYREYAGGVKAVRATVMGQEADALFCAI
jgi:hypothetical protein